MLQKVLDQVHRRPVVAAGLGAGLVVAVILALSSGGGGSPASAGARSASAPGSPTGSGGSSAGTPGVSRASAAAKRSARHKSGSSTTTTVPVSSPLGNGPPGSGHGPTLVQVDPAIAVYARRLDAICTGYRTAAHHPPAALEQQAMTNAAVMQTFVIDLARQWLGRLEAVPGPARVRPYASRYFEAMQAAISAFSQSNPGTGDKSPVIASPHSGPTPRSVISYEQAARDVDRATNVAQRMIGFKVCGSGGSPWL
ncbi:MAG: hypothetical protein ACYC91_06750 [Solirubrobacteraceae bacterium]